MIPANGPTTQLDGGLEILLPVLMLLGIAAVIILAIRELASASECKQSIRRMKACEAWFAPKSPPTAQTPSASKPAETNPPASVWEETPPQDLTGRGTTPQATGSGSAAPPPHFPTTPEADPPGIPDLWKDVGILKALGYSVGKKGLPESHRREILTMAITKGVPAIHDDQWRTRFGMPGSRVRLEAIVGELEHFARMASSSPSKSVAVSHWTSDAEWLKREKHNLIRE